MPGYSAHHNLKVSRPAAKPAILGNCLSAECHVIRYLIPLVLIKKIMDPFLSIVATNSTE